MQRQQRTENEFIVSFKKRLLSPRLHKVYIFTAHYDHADIGLAVCMGDRGKSYDEACVLLAEHRKNLVEGLNFVKEKGVIQLKNLQYFDSGNKIRETIVGIVAGMSASFVTNRQRQSLLLLIQMGG